MTDHRDRQSVIKVEITPDDRRAAEAGAECLSRLWFTGSMQRPWTLDMR
ncbi:hypothetical protein [Streptomyces cavourensis]